MAERVIIAIPTFRRPHSLKRLLDAIAGSTTELPMSPCWWPTMMREGQRRLRSLPPPGAGLSLAAARR